MLIQGSAFVHWDSSRPKANGWAVYDGSSWKPSLKEGEAMPGTPGVTIKNLSSGLGCTTDCLPEAKLLEDGSILDILTVAWAPYKSALFRINGDKAEKIMAEDESVTVGGQTPKACLGRILAANATSLVWLFPSGTSEPMLVAAPHFTVDGNSISDTDILAWKANGEVVARSENGLFLLRSVERN